MFSQGRTSFKESTHLVSNSILLSNLISLLFNNSEDKTCKGEFLEDSII